MTAGPPPEPPPTDGDPAGPNVPDERDERASAATHAVGFLLAVAAAPILVVGAVRRGGAADVVGSSVFAGTMLLLYLASTVFHLARDPTLRRRLQRADHAAIYLLIAGTYTPFTLGVLGGAWGWTLFGLVWGAAAVGVAAKVVAGPGHPRLSTAMYLVMGWLVVVALRPLLREMPAPGLVWLVAGGVSYSVGVAFYTARRLPYGHAVWHLFVLGGSVCHFFAVLWYAI